jgi:2-keto-3-deoxy-L-fuconate dehydrogenase
MTSEWDGRRAIVTGGASGIGLDTAQLIESLGGRVVVLDRAIGGLPAGLAGLKADVSDDSAVRAAVDEAARILGGIDVVVNNAGIGAQGTIESHGDDEWHTVLDINLLGTVRVSRAALPHLRHSTTAAIVNVCSIAATAGLPDRALYSASKGAILSLTRAMAADLLPEGIRVNAVNPGTADTPWVGRLLSSAADPVVERAALEARQPHGRLVTGDEIARAIVYLASPTSGSTTGTSIAVDGGMAELRLRPRA